MPLAPDALEALEATCREAFTKFDADGSGEIDTNEIDALMKARAAAAASDRRSCSTRRTRTPHR